MNETVEKIVSLVNENKVAVAKELQEKLVQFAEDNTKALGDLQTDLQTKVDQKLSALEAKLATSPAIVKSVGAKSALQEAHRDLVSQTKARKEFIDLFSSKGHLIEIKQEAANIINRQREASALTGSGVGIGARIDYMPQFRVMRQTNVYRMLARIAPMGDPTLQFRVKTGNSGITWGYTVDQTNAIGTNNAAAWNVNASMMNCRFDTRTSALDDIDGLESNLVLDLLAEADQAEGGVMQQNDTTLAAVANSYQVGANGVKGLDSYGFNGTAAAGATLVGSLDTNGNHKLTTVFQGTLATATAVNVKFTDILNLIYSIPEQYLQMGGFSFVVSRPYANAIRVLTDLQGTPLFDRDNTFMFPGRIGSLYGYPVYVNEYMDSPFLTTGIKYPMYFGQFGDQLVIGDTKIGTIQRFTETVPGSVTYYYEKRFLSQINDPTPFARLASTTS